VQNALNRIARGSMSRSLSLSLSLPSSFSLSLSLSLSHHLPRLTHLKVEHRRLSAREALIRLRLTVNAVCSQRWGSLRGSTWCLTR